MEEAPPEKKETDGKLTRSRTRPNRQAMLNAGTIPDKNEKQQYIQQQNSALSAYAIFSHIGFTMVACVFIGVFLGKFLDDRLGFTQRHIIMAITRMAMKWSSRQRACAA